MDLRTRGQTLFPTMSTRMIHDYFGQDPEARAEARRKIFEQYGDGFQSIQARLRNRFGYIAGDVIQEAWVRCYGVLDQNAETLQKPRPDRPSTGQLIYKEARRAQETLLKREKRWWQRKISESALYDAELKAAQIRGAKPKLSAAQYRSLLTDAWQQLVDETAVVEERDELIAVGPVAVYAGDWELATARAGLDDGRTLALPRLVVEKRARLRELLVPLLKQAGLTLSEIKRFLMAILPENDQ